MRDFPYPTPIPRERSTHRRPCATGLATRALAWTVALGLVVGPSAPPARAQDAPRDAEPEAEVAAPSGRISGRVLRGPGVDAEVRGSRVLAYHVEGQREYASEPVGRDGKFVLEDLPRGYFDLAVETPAGLYVAAQVVHLPPSGKVRLEFTLAPYPGGEPIPDRERYAGRDDEGAGLAEIARKVRGRDFWRSPAGIAILAGTGGAAVLGVALSGDDDERLASPF